MVYQETLFKNSEIGEISLFVFGNRNNIAVDTAWVYRRNQVNQNQTSDNYKNYIAPLLTEFDFKHEYLHIQLDGTWYWFDMTKYKNDIYFYRYFYESMIGTGENPTEFTKSIRFIYSTSEDKQTFLDTYTVNPKDLTLTYDYQPQLDNYSLEDKSKSEHINLVSKYHKEKKSYSFRLNSLKEIPSDEPLYSQYSKLNPSMKNQDNKNNYIEYYPTTIYPADFGKEDGITTVEAGKDTVVVYLPNVYTKVLGDDGNFVIHNDIDVVAETGKFLVFLNGVMVDYSVITTDTPIIGINGKKIYKRIKIEGYGSILKRKYMTLEDGTIKSYRDDTINIYFWDGVRYSFLNKDIMISMYRYKLSLFGDGENAVYYSAPSMFTYMDSANSPIISRKINNDSCIVVRNGNVMIPGKDYVIGENCLYTMCEKNLQELDYELSTKIYGVKENAEGHLTVNNYDLNQYRIEFEEYINSLYSQKVLFFYDEKDGSQVIINFDSTEICVNCPKIGEITVKNHDMSTPIFTGNHIGDFEFVNTEPDGTAALTDGEYSGQKRTVLKTPVTESLLENMYEQSFYEGIDFKPVELSGIKFSPANVLNRISQYKTDHPDFSCDFTHVVEQAIRFAFCSNKVSSREIEIKPYNDNLEDTLYTMINISDDEGEGIVTQNPNGYYVLTHIDFKYSDIDKLFTFGLSALDSRGNYNYHENINVSGALSNYDRSCFLLIVLLKNGKFGIIPFNMVGHNEYGSDTYYVTTLKSVNNRAYIRKEGSEDYNFDLIQHLCIPHDTYYTHNNKIYNYLFQTSDEKFYGKVIACVSPNSVKTTLNNIKLSRNYLRYYIPDGGPYQGGKIQQFDSDNTEFRSLYDSIYIPNQRFFNENGITTEEIEKETSYNHQAYFVINDMFKCKKDSNDNTIAINFGMYCGDNSTALVVTLNETSQSTLTENWFFYLEESLTTFYRNSDGDVDRILVGGNSNSCGLAEVSSDGYRRKIFPFVSAILFSVPGTLSDQYTNEVSYKSLYLTKTAHGPAVSFDFVYDTYVNSINDGNNKYNFWVPIVYPKNFNRYRDSLARYGYFTNKYHMTLTELSRRVSYDYNNNKVVLNMPIYNYTEDDKATYRTLHVETDEIHSDPNKYQTLHVDYLTNDVDVTDHADILKEPVITNGVSYFSNGSYVEFINGDVFFVNGTSKALLGNLFKDSTGKKVDRIEYDHRSEKLRNFPRDNTLSPSENMLVNVGFTDGYGDWMLVNQNHLQTQDEYVASKTVKDYDPYRDTPIRRLRVFEK